MLIKHITGEQLSRRWKKNYYEIIQIMKNADINPDRDAISFDDQVRVAGWFLDKGIPSDLETRMPEILFQLSHVEQLEREHPGLLPITKSQQNEVAKESKPNSTCPPDINPKANKVESKYPPRVERLIQQSKPEIKQLYDGMIANKLEPNGDARENHDGALRAAAMFSFKRGEFQIIQERHVAEWHPYFLSKNDDEPPDETFSQKVRLFKLHAIGARPY